MLRKSYFSVPPKKARSGIKILTNERTSYSAHSPYFIVVCYWCPGSVV